jgi:hypothetical protein
MAEQRIDLKQLIHLIHDNKEFEVNFILDEGCFIIAEDPKPLIKVLNYLINYLTPLTGQPLEISLDLRGNDILMSMMAYTDNSELPPVSDQVSDALKVYNATLENIHEQGKYFQFKLSFSK